MWMGLCLRGAHDHQSITQVVDGSSVKGRERVIQKDRQGERVIQKDKQQALKPFFPN